MDRQAASFGPRVIGKLLNLGGMLERKANQLLLPFGLNQQQYSILFEIKRAGKVNQKAVINRLMLEKAHVSKIIKKLESMALISRTPDTEDRRSSWLSITPKGISIVNDCSKITSAWNRKWIGRIVKNEKQAVLEILSELQEVFRETIEDEN